MDGGGRSEVESLPSDPSHLRLRTLLPHLTPTEAFALWTVPARLTRWWPPKAAVRAGRSGGYHFEWPHKGWHLRGDYRVFLQGRELAFSWRWDHEPEVTKEVTVSFEWWGRGTVLTLDQGTYSGSPHELELRESHLEGWRHFLPRLSEERGATSGGI